MEFDEKVQEVQKAFTAERIKRFAIASPELLKQSDYVKSLYMRMLCALMRSGKATEAQILFVRRLAAGAEVSDDFTELMRQSMNMDAESITAFIEALSPNDMKYYFVLDGCITCVLGTGNDRFAMLAECAELLGVTEIELRYLAQAAKAIVLQSSAAFDEAKKYRTARTENLSLYYLLKPFYNGAIVDTETNLHLYFADKHKLNLAKYDFGRRQNIIVENVIAIVGNEYDSREKTIKLSNRNSVEFRGCEFTDLFHPFQLEKIATISFKNCIAKTISYFCEFVDVQTLNVENNTFRDCRGVLFGDHTYDKTVNMTVNIANNIVEDWHSLTASNALGVIARLKNCDTLTVKYNKIEDKRAWYIVYIDGKCNSVISAGNIGKQSASNRED